MALSATCLSFAAAERMLAKLLLGPRALSPVRPAGFSPKSPQISCCSLLIGEAAAVGGPPAAAANGSWVRMEWRRGTDAASLVCFGGGGAGGSSSS